MSGYTPPTPIIKPFCNSGAEVDPPLGTSSTVANQEIGYPPSQATPLNAGGIPVDIEQTNGIHKFYSSQILSIIAGTRFTFDQDFVDEGGVGTNGYPIGAMLYCDSNNSYQVSLVNNNTANFITTPSYINDGINWSAVIIDELFTNKLTIYDSNSRNNYTQLITDGAGVSAKFLFPINNPTVLRQPVVATYNGTTTVLNYADTNNIISNYNTVLVNNSSGQQVNSITVPNTGEWDISFNASIISSGGYPITSVDIGISTSNTSITPNDPAQNVAYMADNNSTRYSCGLVDYRVTPAGTTIYYLVADVNISGGPSGTLYSNMIARLKPY